MKQSMSVQTDIYIANITSASPIHRDSVQTITLTKMEMDKKEDPEYSKSITSTKIVRRPSASETADTVIENTVIQNNGTIADTFNKPKPAHFSEESLDLSSNASQLSFASGGVSVKSPKHRDRSRQPSQDFLLVVEHLQNQLHQKDKALFEIAQQLKEQQETFDKVCGENKELKKQIQQLQVKGNNGGISQIKQVKQFWELWDSVKGGISYSMNKFDERLTMRGQLKTAAQSLQGFLNPELSVENQIPVTLMKDAKGIVFLSTIKFSMGVGGTLGSGVIMAKLGYGIGWSGPCSIGLLGGQWGMSIGAQKTDFIIILRYMFLFRFICIYFLCKLI